MSRCSILILAYLVARTGVTKKCSGPAGCCLSRFKPWSGLIPAALSNVSIPQRYVLPYAQKQRRSNIEDLVTFQTQLSVPYTTEHMFTIRPRDNAICT